MGRAEDIGQSACLIFASIRAIGMNCGHSEPRCSCHGNTLLRLPVLFCITFVILNGRCAEEIEVCE